MSFLSRIYDGLYFGLGLGLMYAMVKLVAAVYAHLTYVGPVCH